MALRLTDAHETNLRVKVRRDCEGLTDTEIRAKIKGYRDVLAERRQIRLQRHFSRGEEAGREG